MTGSPNQQTDLRKVFYQCRLGRGDLDRLFAMACEGIASPDVHVSTVAGNTRFWHSTLTDLFAVVQAGAPELNGKWSNLAVEAKTESGERSVSIMLDAERAEFNVSGSDATWVYGQAARLEKFLGARGAVTSSPRYETKISLAFMAFFCIMGFFYFTAGADAESAAECVRKAKEAQANALAVNMLIGALLMFGLMTALFQILKRRALRAQLRVDSEVPEGSWWSRLSAAEKIAAVGVPIAGLAAIGALVSAASDVFG